MTREEAIRLLKKEIGNSDIETAHSEADGILCQFLRELGYGDIVDVYREIPKWYA